MQSKIVKALPEHLIALVENLRDREKESFAKLADSEKIAMQTLASSVLAYTGFVDDRPVVIWGVVAGGLLSDRGHVWMIASRELENCRFVFLRRSREAFDLTQQFFNVLEGRVIDDFKCSIQWLEWLGFEVGPAENGIRRFEWIR